MRPNETGFCNLYTQYNYDNIHTNHSNMIDSPIILSIVFTLGPLFICCFSLFMGWFVVWNCILIKIPFVQEIFDIKKKK